MFMTDPISNLVAKICSECQIWLAIIIYLFIFGITISVFCRLNKCHRKVTKLNDSLFDFIKEKDSSKLEEIELNFPILIQELKDVFDSKKSKQISALDIFDNHLIIKDKDTILINTLINSLTALGLLGTFIGLIASISNLDTTSSNAISQVLNAMPTAFGTTIIGVLCSLFCSRYYAFVKSKYKQISDNLSNKLMLERPNDTNPDYFYNSFTTMTGTKYENALKVIIDNFLEQMQKSLKKELEDYKNTLVDATNSLSDSEKVFVESADNLGKTVNTINDYLVKTDELNKNFENTLKDFSNRLNDFNNTFDKTSEATKLVVNNVNEINEKTKGANDILFDNLQKELEETKKSFELIKDMNVEFKKEIMETPNQINAATNNFCDKILTVSKNIENINDSIKETSKTFKQVDEKITDINNEMNKINEDIDNNNITVKKELSEIREEIKDIKDNK